MYVNGSCWQEPLYRHLVCYLQNLEQKQTTSRVFVDLFCSKLFSKGSLRLSLPSAPSQNGELAWGLCPWPQAQVPSPCPGERVLLCSCGCEPRSLCRHGLCSDRVSWVQSKVVLKPSPLTIDTNPMPSPYQEFQGVSKEPNPGAPEHNHIHICAPWREG